MTIKPECRYCGSPVKAFGDTCSDCFLDTEDSDGFWQLIQSDLRALEALQ